MKHNIRINGEVKEIDCELGSGILDKHDNEIFEGDRVKFKDKVGYVSFRHGDFILEGKQLYNYLSGVDYDGNLEIVGHVND